MKANVLAAFTAKKVADAEAKVEDTIERATEEL